MPIAALPKETVRTIGSTQVLTDTASAVKELIDNALDAHASAIFIEISANALDVIQVKDNGYGIAPEDRALICKRYCTSKIATYDDIARIGGTSLGFRGEALASAAEMSGSLILATKIEGEPIATSLKITRQGQTASEERTSHPVGTTVRIVDFLKNLPVRRQTALKATTKTLSAVTKTLQAYALARPSVRFSLKILKAKNEKGNWTYVPKTDASVLDAATKIVGKKTVEQCHWKVWKSSGMHAQAEPPASIDSPSNIFIIESLLPRPDCDLLSATKAGQYISIDSRPVSCTRGTLKQIIALYKTYLRSSCGLHSGDKLNEPFLCMNIVCPEGSYDANVEPAKDDVLFSDARLVLAIVESFFQSLYGELPTNLKVSSTSKEIPLKPQTFDILLAKKQELAEASPPRLSTSSGPDGSGSLQGKGTALEAPPISSTLNDGSSELGDLTVGASGRGSFSNSAAEFTTVVPDIPSSENAWKPNMYAADEDDGDGLFVIQDLHGAAPRTPDPEEEIGLHDARVSNPWSIAKVNASVQPRGQPQSNPQLVTPRRQLEDFQGYHGVSPGTTMGDAPQSPQLLLTPQQSRRVSSDPAITSSSERFPYPLAARNSRSGEHALRSQRAADRERYGTGALDTWVQRSTNGYRPTPGSSPDPDEGLIIDPDTGHTRRREFVSARTLPTGIPLDETPTASTRPRKQSPQKQTGTGNHKPFTSPLTDDSVWPDYGGKHKSKPPSQGRSTGGNQSTLTSQGTIQLSNSSTASSSSSPERPVHPDLALTLDYENRKTLAAQQHRANLLQQQKRHQLDAGNSTQDRTSISKSPHQNRYNRAIAALHQGDETAQNASTYTSPRMPSAFEAGDPRQYWLRVRERENAANAATAAAGPGGEISPSRPLAPTKRRKTALLPLETTKEECSTRDLVLPYQAPGITTLALEAKEMGAWDGYIASGTSAYAGLNAAMTISVVRAWEGQIRELVRRQYQYRDDGSSGQGQLRVELWSAMQAHWGAHRREEEEEGGMTAR